jgi:opacity protein-like surface antigen
MFRKLTVMVVAGAILLSAASAGAQVAGNQDPFAPAPGYGRQAPPQSYQQPQQRQRYQQPAPVQAQPYGRGYDRGYDRGYERRRGYDDGPRYGQRGRLGDYCATSRGACRARPQPVGSSCRCDIDGLTKRGIIQ